MKAYVRAARFLYGPQAELVLSFLHENPELCKLIGHSYAGTASISESIPRITSLLAKHLFQYRSRVRRFRSAAALDADRAALAGSSVS